MAELTGLGEPVKKGTKYFFSHLRVNRQGGPKFKGMPPCLPPQDLATEHAAFSVDRDCQVQLLFQMSCTSNITDENVQLVN